MTTPMTPGQQRTAKALAARKRNSETRIADKLRARGWTCHAPGETCQVVYAGPCHENGIGQCVTPGHNHP